MRRFLIAGFLGSFLFLACGLQGGGLEITTDGSFVDVTQVDASVDQTVDTNVLDITVPDMGMGETEAGVPCTCVGAIPNGWTPVAYNRVMQNICPTYYDTATNLVEAAGAAPTCTCGCNGVMAAPTCTGSIDVDYTFDSTSTCGGTNGSLKIADTCTMGNWPLAPNGNGLNYLKVSPKNNPTATGGTCAAPSVVTTVPPISVLNTRQCKASAPLGSCGMSNACMPNVAGDDKLCIMSTAGNPPLCPMNFPVRIRAGSSYTDTRACPAQNTCQCTFSSKGTCSVPKFYWYSDSQCAAPLVNGQDMNNMCTLVNLGNAQTFLSAKYTSTNSNSACSFAGSFNASGTVTMSNAVTFCCRP